MFGSRLTLHFVFGVWIFPLLVVSGCVQPDVWQDSQLEALQETILARSPQGREEDGLGPMRPGPSTIPPVGILKDLETGKPMARLSLEDVIVRALANNTEIAVVAYEPKIRREQAVQEAARFDYTLFGGIGYSTVDNAWRHRTGRPIEKERTLSAGVRNRTPLGTEWSVTQEMVRSWDDATVDATGRWYQPSLSVDVTQPLLRGAWPGVNLAPLEIARLDYRMSLAQFRAQVEATLVEVITTYYNLLRARGELQIATDLLDATQRTLRRVKGRQEIDATDVQIKQTESAVRTRQAAVIRAAKNVADIQDQLIRLIGDRRLNLLEDVSIKPTTPMRAGPVRISVVDQLLTALVLNPDLEQARLAIRQGEINVRVAKNETLPELNVSAGATMSGAQRTSRSAAMDDMFSGNYISYNAQLTFEYPIGNRRREAQLAQRRLEHHQAVSQLQALSDQVAQTIRERIRQVETRYTDLDLQQQAVAASQAELEALEAIEANRGQLSPEFLNLKLRAQASLAEARQAALAAMTDYNVALVELSQATGAILELNQVRLAMPQVGIDADAASPASLAIDEAEPPTPSTPQPAAPRPLPAPQNDADQEATHPQRGTVIPATPKQPPRSAPPRDPSPLEEIDITDS